MKKGTVVNKALTPTNRFTMLMDCSDSDSDSDSNVERRESFLSHTTYEPDAPVSMYSLPVIIKKCV